tara:strand:- start:355 stop:588 length:234 start_codon:yes stop_codon:yes gene_type:complete
MNEEWAQLMEQMPKLLNELLSAPLRQLNDRGLLPKKGIYLFYEDSKPVYAGRTKSFGAGEFDFYLVKTDGEGVVEER